MKHIVPNRLGHRADDLPAVFLILVLCLAVVALMIPRRRRKKRRWFRLQLPRRENTYVTKGSINGRTLYEHRMVAEEVLGRPLRRGEVVHHVNGVRYDNRPSNLCVMDRLDHDRYHEWYSRAVKNRRKHPGPKSQRRILREKFGGELLTDSSRRGSRPR